MTRLFIAARPPPDLAMNLGRLCPGDEPGVRPVPVEKLHVTLCFLGDADRHETAERLAGALLPRAIAGVGPAVQRFSGGQLVIPVTGVDALARAVDEATVGIGTPRAHEYFGHITIARTKRGATSVIETSPVSAEFPIDRVQLIESRLDATGSAYTIVDEFALS